MSRPLRAFTLVELIAVMAIIALLVGIASLPGAPAAMLWTGLRDSGPTVEVLRTRGRSHRVLDPRSRAVLPHGGVSGLKGKAHKELRRFVQLEFPLSCSLPGVLELLYLLGRRAGGQLC